MSPGRRLDRGLSLAELLVVAAIFLIMAAIAVPALQSADDAGGEVRRIFADAVRTRSLARTSWEATVFRMDIVTGRWRSERADGTPIPGPESDASGWRSLKVGVRFEAVLGTPWIFTFLPNGRGNERAAVRVVEGNSAWILELDPMSGALRAEEQ
ncbi:MAG: prepilin-type N-terminal cleavage/methylation domain-containing protein [Planctomycetes bacterium]|nr:prepilin-type N-terminal cleavage/methylation domain-containing protein [Planctomycetota bacterium]